MAPAPRLLTSPAVKMAQTKPTPVVRLAIYPTVARIPRERAESPAQAASSPEPMKSYCASTSSRRRGRTLRGHRRACENNNAFVMWRSCLCSGSHHRKQELVEELQGNGVLFDVRKLNVGDFLWVAREKVPPVPGSVPFF